MLSVSQFLKDYHLIYGNQKDFRKYEVLCHLLTGPYLEWGAGVSHYSDKHSVGKSPNLQFLLASLFNLLYSKTQGAAA